MKFDALTIEVLGNLLADLVFFAFHLIYTHLQTRSKEPDSLHRKP